MQPVQDITDQQRAAIEWIVRLTPGSATEQDVAAFRHWCAQNPAHARAFVEMRRVWQAMSVAGGKIIAANAVPDNRAEPLPVHWLTRRAMLGGALAASAAGAGYFAFNPPLKLWPALPELTADYRTATGERRQITLASTSSIEMNTQTSIGLRANGPDGERIALLSGESLIQAKSRNLQVVAAAGTVSATNATFNIRRDGEKVTVTCLDGRVTVDCKAVVVHLANEDQVTYSDGGFSPALKIDASLVTSWREGYLVFEDKPLAQVIDEVNRYRRGRIIVANSQLSRRLVNGRFYLARLDEVVDKIKNAFGARVTTLPGGVLILS
ncbi:MAG: DUF4880 domain-containing protein [Hyphomicrobiales bacterium]|nr:MAG: DUF4880 domain-containing protein [Hyphomicrobiales bacterium]